jgi:phage baseplate assembly protein W
MPQPAARQNDPVTGTDTHILLVPSPGGPVPTPTPLPFTGQLMTGLSTDVLIDGLPAAIQGSVAQNVPPHLVPQAARPPRRPGADLQRPRRPTGRNHFRRLARRTGGVTVRRDDFIGSGWAFPAAISRTGSVRLVNGTEEIDASIRMILSTVPGERVMRPEFGCAMWELLFAPLTAGTLGLVEQAVREAIVRWEPRIDLRSVLATGDQATGTVHIALAYVIRSTNDVRNLVFPFYTIPTEEPAP